MSRYSVVEVSMEEVSGSFRVFVYRWVAPHLRRARRRRRNRAIKAQRADDRAIRRATVIVNHAAPLIHKGGKP